MDLKQGDNVASVDIATGKYIGKEKLNKKEFHKIYDSNSNMTVFIPVGEEGKLRKLPSKYTVINSLKIFSKFDLIDSQQIEGSRYKYFKAKVEKVNFKGMLEVYHDLSLLNIQKSISTTERKLWLRLKDKLLNEITHVLKQEKEQVENMLSLKKSELGRF